MWKWKKAFKRIAAFSLAVMMFLGGHGTGNVAYAAKYGVDSLITELSSKTATELSKGKYEIAVSVPGAESEKYNEIILMMDASGSQFANMDEVRTTILDIGENVLNEYGTMHFTLMHFGIAGGTLFTATTMDELESCLADINYEDLKRWPTATNCEGSFVHLQEYVAASPNLQNAYIMYTSDGETNLSEEAKVWYDWKNHPEWQFSRYSLTKIIDLTWTEEKNWISAGEEPSTPTKAIFADIVAEYGEDTASLTAALQTAIRANDYELGKKWVDEAWKQAYDGAGLNYETAYPVSVIEKAFIKVHGMERAWHFAFAYITLGYSSGSAEDHHSASGYANYYSPRKGHRAAAAANELAAMEQVEKLYMIGMGAYGSRKSVLTSWMNASEENKANQTANVFAEHEKITFLDGTSNSANINALLEVLKDLGEQLSLMPMNDVYVVDPMSKWVILEKGSIRIYDGNTCIWDEVNGWLVDNPPVNGAPIALDQDPATGHDRITWKVKDGALLSSDSYSMRYNVTVNKEAEGFVDGRLYPANDPTTVYYTDENDETQEENIKVPLVRDGDPATDRAINLTKLTEVENPDGTTTTYPLQGITFDIYYVGTVDEYTEFVETVAKTYGGPKEDLAAAAQVKFEVSKANEIKTNNVDPVATVVTDINGKAVYNLPADQEDGIFLVIEHEHPAIVEPLDPFVVAVPMTSKDGSGLTYSVDVYPKNELIIPDIKKDVIEIEHEDKSGAEEQRVSVNAGEAFTWIVRGDIPADIAAAKLYEITDTLDNALSYAGNMAVKVEAVSADADNSVSSGDAVYENVLLEKTDYDLTISGQTWTVKLTTEGLAKVVSLVGEKPVDYELRVYFDTIVDSDAQMGKDIPNQATLKYTNSTNFKFEVESDIPEVYTCGISLEKYDAKDNNVKLTGAEFMVARLATAAEVEDESVPTEKLVIAKGTPADVVYVDFYTDANMSEPQVTSVTTDGDGKALIYGLEAGSYYLVETKAPAGYNLLSYPIQMTLDATTHTSIVGVANSNTFELPSTGGIGTTIFTLVGAALTLGSGVVLAGKKRKEEEE